jgi:predicted alpha/beta hydrolase family esterase
MARAVERFSDPTMDVLVTQVEQLLEARVMCMIVAHSTGTVSVVNPIESRPIVRELLTETNWASVMDGAV